MDPGIERHRFLKGERDMFDTHTSFLITHSVVGLGDSWYRCDETLN